MSLVGDWRVSEELSSMDHKQIHFALKHVKDKWGHNSRYMNWEGYRADLEIILKKAPSRFHTLDNLEMAAQFTSDYKCF